MDSIYRYFLCVICTVILCGVLRSLFPADNDSLIKFVTGLAVTVVILSPLMDEKKIDLRISLDEILAGSETAVQNGVLAANQTCAGFIKEKTEAYVLNKASEFGAQVDVIVTLSDTDLPTPSHIAVSGAVSPYAKVRLSECIRDELGIDEDDQEWISKS